jgi:hypothetical protein
VIFEQPLIGEVAYIHGRPYVFERRLGSGSFGKINLKKQRIGFFHVKIRFGFFRKYT